LAEVCTVPVLLVYNRMGVTDSIARFVCDR